VSDGPFASLDFVYTPSRDVAGDAKYFTEVLGGRLLFAVEGMGARGALIDLTGQKPYVLLIDHLDGERPVLVYRVEDLGASLARLERRGWTRREVFEIPHGPCCSFASPSGHRIALYQVTRPEADHFFDGRKDF
jgi:hypothetical protein